MAPRAEEEFEDFEIEGGEQGLSKGVFAYKRSKRTRPLSPKKGGRKRRKMAPQDQNTQLKDQFLENCFASKNQHWARERVVVHNSLVKEVEVRVDNIQKNIFKSVHDSILHFVEASQKLTHSTIPTAVLLTGVNMPDHSKVIGHLVDRLKSVTPHISLLGSGLNLKQLVVHLVMDIVNSQDDDDEVGLSVVKKSEASFKYLQDWYSSQYAGDQKPPLVFVIQDFENCSGSALNDLITLCSRYLSTLPVIMIFGVATTLSAVHKSLPQSTTAKLTINTFGSPNAALHLEEVVKAVVLDTEVPFKLSGRVFQFLRENFLFHDFSVNQFLAGYRFILGEHFYRNPAAALVLNETDCLKKIEDMDLEDLSFICRLNSFREYMSELELDEQAEILINPVKAKQTIKPLIQEYFDYLKTFTTIVQVLHIVSRDLPRRPLGRLLSEVYEPALAGDIHNSQQYREAFQFLKLSNRTDLETKMNLVKDQVGGLPLLSEFLAKVEENLEKLRNLDSDIEYSGSPAVQSLAARFNSSSSSSPCILPSNLDNSSNTPAPSSSNTPQPSSSNAPNLNSSPNRSSVSSPVVGKSVKLDRYKLQATLLEAAHRNQKLQMRPFDLLRSELMILLHQTFKNYLQPPTMKPLHEIFFFTATATVRRHLVGAPRAALHTALTDPHLYLEHPDLEIQDQGEIPPTLPDICVGYKLHLECPRLINVYDWLSCWHSIISAGAESISEEEQARFARIVSELHYIGFIKSSTRKTDHVARLTFGGS